MSLLLYGIVTENALPADFDVSLLLIHADGLTAVTACCEQADQDVESVLAFGNVVERIHQRTTIIPIRYGSLLPDEAAVVELMAEKASHYCRLLADLEGCEEMGIRLPMAAPEPEPLAAKKPSSGYEYLLARKRKYSAAEQAEKEAAALDLALTGLYRKRCGDAGLFAGQHMYLVSYLVHRTQLDAFRAKVDELFNDETQKVIISGPWPPYNFAV
ncbi:MAG: GvpL/GvpF family gas vesicle protein [Proteobacteria bacterium]|nr:GvpL/GvpF family gas vesicle protein [Pseudomonadota bacterium]